MKVRRLFTAGKWTRGMMHGKRNGEDVYCLVGAMRHVARYSRYTNSGYVSAYETAMEALKLHCNRDPIGFNDSQTSVEPVIELIDRALTDV
jgi:hypothetical protein